jgi:two-component system nitrogen regulation sensor histidine kinase GlnL
VKPRPDHAEIVAALQTAILVIDPEGRIDRVNAAAEFAINRSAASLQGKMLSDVLTLPPGFDAGSEAPYAAYDVDLITRRGVHLHGDFVASPFPEWRGWRVIAIHASAAAYRMGHRLERQGSARSAIGIAAMLAHEIKNPLSGIRGASQLLESRASAGDAKLTRLIRSEVDRVTALIDQMEGFTDTRPLALQSYNIHEIIDHALQVARSGFGDRLRIVDSYDPSLPPVMVHRDSLIQILLNLLKNAAETSDNNEKRLVRISTAYRHGVSIAPGGRSGRRPLPIEVCVMDDGPGAPPELADSLFDPFVSSKKTGRGLGLALADKLMREMGGIIQYDREGRPEMTVFRLLLPRAESS